MLIGVSGGIMLSQQNVLFYTALGGLLVTFAGILDSSDGQAARLYNTHSEMGRYLDMFNDMLVFIACYAGGLYYFVDTYTWYGFWGLGLLSGYMHSLKSNIYEYYKGEFLHFSLTDSKNRNYSLEYIRENFDRTGLIRSITYPILIDYVRRQNQNINFGMMQPPPSSKKHERTNQKNSKKFTSKNPENYSRFGPGFAGQM